MSLSEGRRFKSLQLMSLYSPAAPAGKLEVRGQRSPVCLLTAPALLPLSSVGREENRSLARSDWSRGRTQEGGSEERRGGRRARVEGDGRGEGGGGGGEEG